MAYILHICGLFSKVACSQPVCLSLIYPDLYNFITDSLLLEPQIYLLPASRTCTTFSKWPVATNRCICQAMSNKKLQCRNAKSCLQPVWLSITFTVWPMELWEVDCASVSFCLYLSHSFKRDLHQAWSSSALKSNQLVKCIITVDRYCISHCEALEFRSRVIHLLV